MESIKALEECIELQKKKSKDYQYEKSSVKQADYYPRGVDTLYDIMLAKMLRFRSVADKLKNGENAEFESMEDSMKDLINYASFTVAWLRRDIQGQRNDVNLFGEKHDDKFYE
jgi:hypothetical protein